MKKLLLVLLSVLFTLQTQASHLMGGQITSRNLGGLYYQVTLNLYRDTLGIPMSTNQTITYTDSTGNFVIATHTVGYIFNGHIGNGVEKYTFTDTITFPFVGKFKAYASNCCRNASILNLPNPSGNSLYLDVDIFADPSNSSPTFLNEPITVAQLNQPFSYNPTPYDVDGDSLSWQLDIPYDILNGTTLGSPIPGYVLPPSDTLVPFSIDPLTGEITFLPNVVGNFQVSVKAIEWRNGIQIGYIRRDMQLLVVPSSNIPLNVQANISVFRISSTSTPIYANPGDTVLISLIITNPDNNSFPFPSSIGCTVRGSALLTSPAVPIRYFAWTTNGFTVSATWVPTLANVNYTPYYIVFRLSDTNAPYIFYTDYTFRIIVTNNTTGVNEINPTLNKTFIKSINMLGQEIDPNSYGFRIDLYSDGTAKKVYKTN